MSRGIGEIEFAAGLPDAVAFVAALLTALGDVWFVFALLGTLYWFGSSLPGPVALSRRHAAFVIALAFGGLAVVTTLKELLRLPRPPGAADPAGAGSVPETLLPLYAEVGSASGFGFPSGHAISAVVAYGGLALLIGGRRSNAAAVALCVAIPLSRIALGVHYLVDIVVGVALGGVFVFVTFRSVQFVSRDRVTVVLVIAIVTAGLYVFESRADLEAVLALGIALGLFGGWQLVVLAREVLARTRPSQTARPIAVRGGLAALSFAPLVAALEFVPLLAGEPFPLGAIAGIGAALAVVLPIARYSPHVAAVLAGLSFWLRAALATLRSILRRTAGRLRSR